MIEAADAIPAIAISFELEVMSGSSVGPAPLFDQEIDRPLFALTIRFHNDVVRLFVIHKSFEIGAILAGR